MKIEIEIKDPPEGYNIPKYGPLFLPIGINTLVLIGQCWCKASHEVSNGGRYWIYCDKNT